MTLPGSAKPIAAATDGAGERCARCGAAGRRKFLGTQVEPDGSKITRSRFECDRQRCSCANDSGECRCSPWAAKSSPTHTQNSAYAEFTQNLRKMPEASLREAARFMTTVGRQPEADAARLEVTRRRMRRQKRIAEAIRQRTSDPVHTSVGAALFRAAFGRGK